MICFNAREDSLGWGDGFGVTSLWQMARLKLRYAASLQSLRARLKLRYARLAPVAQGSA